MRVTCTVNVEQRVAGDAWEGESLRYVLRERLGLPGSKNACEQGECGSCTVIMDGVTVCACLVAAGQAQDRDIRTVEGLAAGHPEIARRAAARIAVRYEVLEPVTTARAAMAAGAPALHPGGNIVRHLRLRHGDPAATAGIVVTGDYQVGMQDQAFLGPESALAVPDGEGGADLFVATQWLHADQRLRRRADRVRLRVADGPLRRRGRPGPRRVPLPQRDVAGITGPDRADDRQPGPRRRTAPPGAGDAAAAAARRRPLRPARHAGRRLQHDPRGGCQAGRRD